MLWSEIKKWSKEQGFQATKQKDDSINGASYYWSKIDDPSISGVCVSVSKLATTIFNHLTDNKWIDHQEQYKASLNENQY